LIAAADAIHLDTSHLDVEAAVNAAITIAESKR
jgi:cytidylate kinase